MPDQTQDITLNHEQRDHLIQELGTLIKQRVSLQQALREQQEQAITANEELFLELLEAVDALEALLDYMANHPELSAQFVKRLPKSLASVQHKFLSVLERRQVSPLEFQGIKPDFSLCRVVDREVRTDLEDQTITKVVRRGFRSANKILRPVEVITSKMQ